MPSLVLCEATGTVARFGMESLCYCLTLSKFWQQWAAIWIHDAYCSTMQKSWNGSQRFSASTEVPFVPYTKETENDFSVNFSEWIPLSIRLSDKRWMELRSIQSDLWANSDGKKTRMPLDVEVLQIFSSTCLSSHNQIFFYEKMQLKEGLHKMFRTDLGKCQLTRKNWQKKVPSVGGWQIHNMCIHIYAQMCPYIYTYTYVQSHV